MNYTIELVRTVAGKRYYIRCNGKLMRSGFANRTAAVERLRFLQVMDSQAQSPANQHEQSREVQP